MKTMNRNSASLSLRQTWNSHEVTQEWRWGSGIRNQGLLVCDVIRAHILINEYKIDKETSLLQQQIRKEKGGSKVGKVYSIYTIYYTHYILWRMCLKLLYRKINLHFCSHDLTNVSEIVSLNSARNVSFCILPSPLEKETCNEDLHVSLSPPGTCTHSCVYLP
jgi:hypothetical protein